MKLYDIPVEIEACFDEETGAINEERLKALLKTEEAKLEWVGKSMKNEKAEIDALDAEIEALSKRKKSKEKSYDSKARFVGAYLGGEKRTVGSVKFQFLGKQEGKVNLLCKASELPEKYRTESISYRENITALRAAIIAKDKDVVQYATLDPRPKASVK